MSQATWGRDIMGIPTLPTQLQPQGHGFRLLESFRGKGASGGITEVEIGDATDAKG